MLFWMVGAEFHSGREYACLKRSFNGSFEYDWRPCGDRRNGLGYIKERELWSRGISGSVDGRDEQEAGGEMQGRAEPGERVRGKWAWSCQGDSGR